MFRELSLPDKIPGKMYLSGMLGRYADLDAEVDAIVRRGISRVVSLASLEEVSEKSDDYFRRLEAGSLGLPVELFAIPDYGIPAARDAFSNFVNGLADRLRAGERLLMHCGAGIGRTGTVAACVLIALGVGRSAALAMVRAAGSGPETEEQYALVTRFAATGV